MIKQLLKSVIGWGILLWLIGYLLGMILFFLVPENLLGWIIMPIGTLITIWVLWKKIHATSLIDWLGVSITWTVIAILFDYLFLVLLLQPENGYYKFDVYLYYIFTFALPLIIGWFKSRRTKTVEPKEE